MEKYLDLFGKYLGKGFLVKTFFNLSPMYRRTGGRLVEVSEDLHYVKIKLPLTYKTRNYVGTLYGGHIYSCVDGIYMIQLMSILGSKYVVWDKSACIKFRRPGSETLFAEFRLSKSFIKEIKEEIDQIREGDFTLHVNLVNESGKVFAEVEKILYIAEKEFYKSKRKKKQV